MVVPGRARMDAVPRGPDAPDDIRGTKRQP
jgi:hypothetical protein